MTIPDNLRVATIDDFYEPLTDRLILEVPFYVHTFHSNELEPHKTFKDMNFKRWDPWFKENRIYIDKGLVLRSRANAYK